MRHRGSGRLAQALGRRRSKDGPRPHSQSGPGTHITLDEAQLLFGSADLRFVGSEPPSINSDRPSHSVKNVIVAVEDNEGSSALFPEAGFYFVVDMRPPEVESKLHAYREAP